MEVAIAAISYTAGLAASRLQLTGKDVNILVTAVMSSQATVRSRKQFMLS